MDIKTVLEDIKTYYIMKNNQNFNKRLFEAYYTMKQNNIKTLDEFESSNIGIGAFTYIQLTIFDRLKDEKYRTMLEQHLLSMTGLNNLSKDYGDQLASWDKIGNTPYRESYIKAGYITEDLTSNEKNKFYK